MGSKNSPGEFDCYANADPDEPMFVLLGRDRFGPSLVEAWADAREAYGESPEKVAEARECAAAMRRWLEESDKREEDFFPFAYQHARSVLELVGRTRKVGGA